MAKFEPIITGVIGAILTGAILSWVSRGASNARTDGLLRYGGRMRAVAVGLLGIALFIGCAALNASPDQRVIAGIVGGAEPSPLVSGSSSRCSHSEAA